MNASLKLLRSGFVLTTLALTLTGLMAGCSKQASQAPVAENPKLPAESATAAAGAQPDVPELIDGEQSLDTSQELPVRKVPNIPEAAEPYYANDNLHIVAEVQDPKALHSKNPRAAGGALDWIFTDQGIGIEKVNDHGQDACAYFFPDDKHFVFTSTRDNMKVPIGNWSDPADYPKGAELYITDLSPDYKVSNIRRLTHNDDYEAEVSVSPDGKWLAYNRQHDGMLDIWRMRPDGSDQQQITHTPDWEEGAPFFLPDSQTIMFRAWKKSEFGKVQPTPMTVFTIKVDGTDLTQRTFDNTMNWAPYPAPDGRHYVFVRVAPDNNWEIYLGDLENARNLKRLSYHAGFDGFPSLSRDGKKMVFTRSEGKGFMSDLYTYVMDVSSLNLGPENYKGVPAETAH